MTETKQAIIATVVGVVFTLLARLVDKWLPDRSGQYPVPTYPSLGSRPGEIPPGEPPAGR